MNESLQFKKGRPYTIGVEVELQLLAKETLDLASRAPEILSGLPLEFQTKIKKEFIQSMVEVTTGVCSSLTEIENDLRRSILFLETRADLADCRVFAGSLHPFAQFSRQTVTSGVRYEHLMQELALAGRRLISQGLHIHVGLDSGDTAIRVFNAVRRYLPVILSLSCSSPFYQGQDTGFQSYRSQLLDCLPRSGIPASFQSWEDFEKFYRLLVQQEIIDDIREIWWDIRPHADFGTIEIRIADIPDSFTAILEIICLMYCLIYHLSLPEHGQACPENLEILKINKWQAARHGLRGYVLDATGGQKIPMQEAAHDLITMLAPTADQLNGVVWLTSLEKRIDQLSSSDRQRQIYQQHHDFKRVIGETAKGFWEK